LTGSDSDHARLYFLDPLDGSNWLQLKNVTSSTPGLDSTEVGVLPKEELMLWDSWDI
jgi:hypothetical protein